jgi:hypothetical protein
VFRKRLAFGGPSKTDCPPIWVAISNPSNHIGLKQKGGRRLNSLFACLHELGHHSNPTLGLRPSVPLALSLSDSDWATRPPGSLAYRWQNVRTLSLHTCEPLLLSLSIRICACVCLCICVHSSERHTLDTYTVTYTHTCPYLFYWLCFSGEFWLIQPTICRDPDDKHQSFNHEMEMLTLGCCFIK